MVGKLIFFDLKKLSQISATFWLFEIK